MNDNHYVFREIAEIADLRAWLAMRFRVYCDTPGHGNHSSIDVATGLDAESFDLYARHFGVFARRNGVDTLVGGIRIVGTDLQPLAPMLLELGRRHESLGRRIFRPRPAILPAADYFADKVAVENYVVDVMAKGARIVEPGRLVLDPEHRMGSGSRSRAVARHVLESAIGFCLTESIDVALVTCMPAHAGCYRRYGFVAVPHTMTRHQRHLGYELGCFSAEANAVPAPARDRCLAQGRMLARSGEVCSCGVPPSVCPETADLAFAGQLERFA